MISMIACVDVDYENTRAVAAGIAFRDWLDDSVVAERVVSLSDIQPYQSGQFFIRELPCLLSLTPSRKAKVSEPEGQGRGQHCNSCGKSDTAW